MGRMEKKMETTRDHRDYIGYILGIYWGYIGIVENNMETIIVYRSYIGYWVVEGGQAGLSHEATGRLGDQAEPWLERRRPVLVSFASFLCNSGSEHATYVKC